MAVAARALTGSDPERGDGPAAAANTAWQRIEPGGHTRTARGEPYAFWVRRGDPRRMMLFFQEGGGCFSYETCVPLAVLRRRGRCLGRSLRRRRGPRRAGSAQPVPRPHDRVHPLGYVAIAGRYPEATFAQFNYVSDAVQRDFYAGAGGDPAGFDGDLRAALDEIRERAPNFRSYLAPGVDHCVLPLATFYTLRNRGVSVRDWTARLADGRPVRDVG
jgi:hypothetical protein